MSERNAYVAEVLAEAVEKLTSDKARLDHGLKLREQIHAAIERGQEVNHPRWLWLQAQAKSVLDLLFAMATDYDKSHPEDKVSILDLLDILGVAEKRLEAARKAQGVG